METYISMLRGINVSGKNKVLMSDLKIIYEKLLFQDIKTYIQSGNVIFKTNSKTGNEELERLIKSEIYTYLKLDIPVIIRTLEELKNIIKLNPFLNLAYINTEKLYITFLSENPQKDNVDKLKEYKYPPDSFVINNKNIFIHCPDNYGESKFSNKFFESKLKVCATTRNWKTINKLLELAIT